MARQDRRREETRGRLLETARGLFLEHGYVDTTTQMILTASGLSKGAMYHHFESKKALFEVLYENVSKASIDAALVAVDMSQPPLERFKTSTLAWLKEIRQPEVATLLLELGPEALGWKRAKKIEDAYSLPAMMAGLEAAQASGDIQVASVEMTARFINAVLAEAAFLYHEKGDVVWPDILQSVEQMFESLCVKPS